MFKDSEIQLMPTRIEAQISLYEAKRGTTRTLVIKDPVLCLECVEAETHRCKMCAGRGYTHIFRQAEIAFPEGVLNDAEICFPGIGLYNLCAGKNSDLVVKIKICTHPYLELKGKNVACTLVVPFVEALFGKNISIPTISGPTRIKLHPLTISGKTYKLKGHGLAGGDQFINIEVLPWQKANKVPISGSLAEKENKADDRSKQTLSLPDIDSAVGWVV